MLGGKQFSEFTFNKKLGFHPISVTNGSVTSTVSLE